MVSFVLDRIPNEPLSISPLSVPEGSGVATLSVTRSRAGSPASVNFTTTTGTASASDFVSNSGVVTFGASQTSATISIAITNDPTDEPDESFSVVLSNPTGAMIANGQANVTITDDDAPSAISIDDARFAEGTASAATGGKVAVRLDRASR